METFDYFLAWTVYLVAAVAMSVVSWSVLKKYLWREAAYLLQCLLIAAMFTPWYVLPDEEVMAPAVIIFFLDFITIDPVTSIRALIPLVMASLLGIIIAIVLSVIYRIRRKKHAARLVPEEDPA